MTKKTSTPSLESWQVESFRLTAFVAPEQKFQSASWWEDLTKTLPEQQSNSPRLNASRSEGRWENGTLILSTIPGRIDWVFTAAGPQGQAQPAGQEFSLGPWAAVDTLFSGRMRDWLKVSPPLTRLAFGAALNTPVEDRKSGFYLMQACVPFVKIDPKGTRDLLYQINRPRKTSTGLFSFPLNRLSTWTVVQRSPVALSISTGVEGVSAVSNRISTEYLVRLELDMSTPSEHIAAIANNRLGDVLSELSRMAVEIATKGDLK